MLTACGGDTATHRRRPAAPATTGRNGTDAANESGRAAPRQQQRLPAAAAPTDRPRERDAHRQSRRAWRWQLVAAAPATMGAAGGTLTGGFNVGPGGAPQQFNPLAVGAGYMWLEKYYSKLLRLHRHDLHEVAGGERGVIHCLCRCQDLHLQAAPEHQVARRDTIHERGCAVLDGDGARPQHRQRPRGAVQIGAGGANARPAHGGDRTQQPECSDARLARLPVADSQARAR